MKTPTATINSVPITPIPSVKSLSANDDNITGSTESIHKVTPIILYLLYVSLYAFILDLTIPDTPYSVSIGSVFRYSKSLNFIPILINITTALDIVIKNNVSAIACD